jgi:hypothetical protein
MKALKSGMGRMNARVVMGCSNVRVELTKRGGIHE